MMGVRTYLDSGVLIIGAHGTRDTHAAAMSVLGDTDREFIASDFVRIETLPKAQYYKQASEVMFCEEYFRSVHLWVLTTPHLINLAMRRASDFGLIGVDALHIAAAELGGAEEFVTTEKPTRPIFRATTVRVISLHP